MSTVTPPPMQLHGTQLCIHGLCFVTLAEHGVVSCIHRLHDRSTYPQDALPTLGVHHPSLKHLTSLTMISRNTVPSRNKIPMFGERRLHINFPHMLPKTVILLRNAHMTRVRKDMTIVTWPWRDVKIWIIDTLQSWCSWLMTLVVVV